MFVKFVPNNLLPLNLHMNFLIRSVRSIAFLCACSVTLLLPSPVFAETYNIVYLVTDDIEQALDYKEDIESILGVDVGSKIQVMGKGKDYCVVFDDGGSVALASKMLVEHGDLLEKAGFDQPYASSDEDFIPLYNVSYGMGPNIDALKKVYDRVYGTLGDSVGRDLFIEQTAKGNYTLIYRRRGSKETTEVVARRHAKVLRSQKIKTSISQENNNIVVFGESSLLDEEEPVVAEKEEITHPQTVQPVGVKPIGQVAVVDHKKPGEQIKPTLTPSTEGTLPTPKPIETDPIQLTQQVDAIKRIVAAESAAEAVAVVAPVKPVVKPEVAPTKVYLAQETSRYKKTVTPKMREFKSKDSLRFEQSIERHIAGLRSKGRISADESTAWMVFDLASDKSIVAINGNRQFQSASMIKPFVALAFFHKVKRGELNYGPKSRRNMTAMIQRSSNSATNWVMRQVGGPAATEKILKQHYSHIFKGLDLNEYIPAGGRTYKNKAYPSDYVRYLRELWDHKLPYSKEMRRLMALPGRDRLYFGTPIPRGTLVYNKTGSTAHLCGDMGILVPKTRSGSRYPYVIVGIVEKQSRPANYSSWVNSRSKIIREVSTIVYKEMKKDHKLL